MPPLGDYLPLLYVLQSCITVAAIHFIKAAHRGDIAIFSYLKPDEE